MLSNKLFFIGFAIVLLGTAGAVFWPASGVSAPEEIEPGAVAENAALEDLPGLYFDSSYRVDPFLRAAVALQAMGKEKACEKLLELSTDPRRGDRVIVLCRMLFTKKAAGIRRPMLGGPVFLAETSAMDWPLEPIELVDGVPFLITRGYELGGSPEPGEGYLKYCITACAWNDVAFTVPGPKAKQAALDKLLQSPKWKARLGDEEKKFLAAQIESPVKVDESAISAVKSWHLFEQSYVDRRALKLDKSTATLEKKPNRVVRRDAAGKEEWSTPLGDEFHNHYWPGLIGDARRVFVQDSWGAVTALAADTGKVLWRTEGSKGGGSCFWLSGDLLLVGLRDRVVGHSAETGKESFNLVLPDSFIASRFEIVEVSGLFLVWNRYRTNPGSPLLIDRSGKVRLRFPDCVADAIPAGKDWVYLTGKELVRISMDDKTLWRLPFEPERGHAGQIVKLSDGGFLACLYGPISDSGVNVIRFDPDNGKKYWQTYCRGLGVGHSKYKHDAHIDMVNGQVRVTSNGSSDTFVELLKLNSGERIHRSVGRLEPIRGMTIGEAVKELRMDPKKCTIFDEPPGVARGVRGRMDDGRAVSLWISRTDGVFREKRDWTFEMLSGLKVAAVEEK
jgi:outer membrane protein assembly factor BamB